jgi:hypothetical protein
MRRSWMLAAGGFVAGVVAVVACGQTGKAGASPADCAVWEYNEVISAGVDPITYTDPVVGGTKTAVATVVLPGWEPFAVDVGRTYMRRCKP